MSWWTPSWLPSLPSIDFTLPSSIQKRFISFALRQALGHLLKPGQLDVQQVDSQIGSGFVQIRDVELDNKAINALIAGLPLQLHDGSVGKVTARIPWPNPLTSTVGLSLESLHLTFTVSPTPQQAQSRTSAGKVAESVASVAESFVHDELDAQEEATLLESMYSELSSSSETVDHVPGGLDPFLSEDEAHSGGEPSGVSIFASLVERLLSRFEFDCTDLKITLVHPEHASFTLSVQTIRYRTDVKEAQLPPSSQTDAGDSSPGITRSINVSGLTVTTRCLRPPSPQPMVSRGSPSASTVSYTTPTATPGYASRSPAPSPPLSDSSDLDEETTMLMSQSLAGLPPRPISPSSSVSSSMYQSAVSIAPIDHHRTPSSSLVMSASVGSQKPSSPPIQSELNSRPKLDILTEEIEDEMLCSLGNEPVIVQMWTPSHVRRQSSDASSSSSSQPRTPSVRSSRKSKNAEPRDPGLVKFDVTIGVVAIALRARHIRSIVDFASLWGSHAPTPPPSTEAQSGQPSRAFLQRIDADLQLRGVIITLLPTRIDLSSPAETLANFFTQPLKPPRLSSGYVRIHLDELSVTASMQPTPSHTPLRDIAHLGNILTTRVSLAELSAFAFIRSDSADLIAVPLLITDPHLPYQYDNTHVHPNLKDAQSDTQLPTFDVIDWTDPVHQIASAKLSAWRTKPSHNRGPSVSTSPRAGFPGYGSPVGVSPSSPATARGTPKGADIQSSLAQPAVVIKVTVTSAPSNRRGRSNGKDPENGVEVEINVAPLHVFTDISQILGQAGSSDRSETLSFLDEVTSSGESVLEQPGLHNPSYDEEEDEEELYTPPGTPRARQDHSRRQEERAREQERLRLERLVLEDLDLEYDYGQAFSDATKGNQPARGTHKKTLRRRKQQRLSVTCHLPAVRVEIRAASHAAHKPRSGAVILDIHDLRVSNGDIPEETAQALRFADPDENPELSRNDDSIPVMARAQWSRLVVAHCALGESRTVSLLSLGPLSQRPAQGLDIPATESPLKGIKPSPRPRIAVSQSVSRSVSSGQSMPGLVTLALMVDIPSVIVNLSKNVVDGLQLWADDISRITEMAFSSRPASANNSRDPSLIGSRFFAKTQRSDGGTADSTSTVSAQRTEATKETVIKATVSEVALVIDLPRLGPGSSSVRPFNVVASDVDVLLEVKPEGKEETVVTLGVMDISVIETSSDGSLLTFLGLTTPHDMGSHTQTMLKLRFTSFIVANTVAKESRIKVTLCGTTFTLHPDLKWINDLVEFAKAPPGVFDSVVPSERTVVSVKVVDSSVRALCPTYPGALVLHIGEGEFGTAVVGNSPESSLRLSIQTISLFLLDDLQRLKETSHPRVSTMSRLSRAAGSVWKAAGYALLAELAAFDFTFAKRIDKTPPDIRITIGQGDLRLHLCADTGTAIGAFLSDFSSLFVVPSDPSAAVPKQRRQPAEIASPAMPGRDLLASIDEQAFRKRIPEIGPAPDMIDDDLPSNLDYLDQSFNASAGLMALDEDEDDFYPEDPAHSADQSGVIAIYGGETIRLLDPEGLRTVEHYFDTLPPDSADESSQYGDTSLKVRVHNGDITVFLYDGYDWERTRRTIEEETKQMRRKLARIRQLLATGQSPDPSVEETNALLFNSVYIGLEHNVDELEPDALIEAIDAELNEDVETASQSSWQSFKPQQMSPGKHEGQAKRSRKVLTRSKGPCIEFRLRGLEAEVDNYAAHESLASRTLVTVRDIEILDHIKTSTWSKFLTSLRTDSRGNIRETGSNMVRVELRKVCPVVGNPAEEARLRAKVLPLRLHVDQDALDFLKKFFSFKDPQSAPPESAEPSEEIFFQQVEVFPVDLKLDYKPRRVDYRALRDGRTIELMNFFHFDGAEMTLRHITLTGITGWARMGDLLNDLWTPDVKATQLVEVISGVAPIRSVVNVGSGVADLVLLPISQYKKDGRVVRGLQKGTTAFVRSTATEAVKLGARLATGTQVILEQAENVIGGQFNDSVTAEALQIPVAYRDMDEQSEDILPEDLISRYADQPAGVREGVVSAYKSLRRNLTSAAQTILAVPMEVYERSGNEGAVRAVVRAVPIAVLRPMIGASEAISQTLLGLHNTLDPNVRAENEAKYKQR